MPGRYNRRDIGTLLNHNVCPSYNVAKIVSSIIVKHFKFITRVFVELLNSEGVMESYRCAYN